MKRLVDRTSGHFMIKRSGSKYKLVIELRAIAEATKFVFEE